MTMRRGDLVTVAISGDYGKPQPAVVVQSNDFVHLPSVTILPFSSDVVSTHLARIHVDPTPENGLRSSSQVMVDKASTITRAKVGPVFGRLDDEIMSRVDGALADFLGLRR
jgi:mRNA interferase MazF